MLHCIRPEKPNENNAFTRVRTPAWLRCGEAKGGFSRRLSGGLLQSVVRKSIVDKALRAEVDWLLLTVLGGIEALLAAATFCIYN